MPISPMDEYLAHQTTETFDYVFTSDRNFYDRYYFNMHDSKGDFFMVAGLGQYPNLGVTDAFAAISHGSKQYVVRASRALGSDRLDTSVGPFRVEVIEGLQSLRLRCDENEWGLSFDIRFDGAVPALEEPKTFVRNRSRVMQDVSRYCQVGHYTGSVTVAGQTYDVTPDHWQGARDRSWGVRSQFGQGLTSSPAQRGGYSYATASADDGFHAITMDFGDGCIGIHGYVIREGQWAKLVSAKREVLERDDETGAPTRVVIDITDDAGRDIRAEGRCLNRVGVHLNPNLFTWNCLTEWTFDGVTAWGEDHDNWSAPAARRFFRKQRGYA